MPEVICFPVNRYINRFGPTFSIRGDDGNFWKTVHGCRRRAWSTEEAAQEALHRETCTCRKEKEMLEVDSSRTKCGFIIVEVNKGENGIVHLKLTATGKGKLTKARLGKMPLPLKLNVKDGTTLSFVLSEG